MMNTLRAQLAVFGLSALTLMNAVAQVRVDVSGVAAAFGKYSIGRK